VKAAGRGPARAYNEDVNRTEHPTARRVRDATPDIALVIGPPAAIAVAGLLAGVRDRVGATNVALVLVAVVVLAAIAGRTAGVVTAIFASVSFNFFHTVPYRSLRITEPRDVGTVVLLVLVGVLVGEVAERRRRTERIAARRVDAERLLEHAVATVVGGADPDTVWQEVRSGVVAVLGAADCRFEPVPMSTLVPPIGRHGEIIATAHRFTDRGAALPSGGASIEVVAAGHTFGQVVVEPNGEVGSLRDERRVAVALIDLYALATARHHEINETQERTPWQTS
jgi:K+-sensing histidine kinase KdpD